MERQITLRVRPLLWGVLLLFIVFAGLFGYSNLQTVEAIGAETEANLPSLAPSPLGSAFTYQGFLQQSGVPVDGVACDFYFALWDEVTGGIQLSTQTNNGVNVYQGVFTVQLDFGSVFQGDGAWLETAVQCPGDPGFTTLTPRQPITATPYALGLKPGTVINSEEPMGLSVNANTVPNQIALYGEANQAGSVGVYGVSDSNTAVYGLSNTGSGVIGHSTAGWGVLGESTDGNGVYGTSVNANGLAGYSSNGVGVYGLSTGDDGVRGVSWYDYGNGVHGFAIGQNGSGVYGEAQGNYADGVVGEARGAWGDGVVGISQHQIGVSGTSSTGQQPGVYGTNGAVDGIGVWGRADAAGSFGVYGSSANSTGVFGVSTNHMGVSGASSTGLKSGVYGANGAINGIGVWGLADADGGVGVYGSSTNNTGVYGVTTNGHGVWGSNGGSNSVGWAGYFYGRVDVNGTLSKAGGSFRIDHPLDPENMILQHSFVESPDMMNVYNGNITLDEQGEAWVVLPDWFEALNRDFRYQLTAVGAPGPNLYIAETVQNNQFKIAGGTPGMTVSWQITGIRHDPWADANRIEVEVPKTDAEQGLYLHPEVYGLPREKGIAAQFENEPLKIEEQQPLPED